MDIFNHKTPNFNNLKKFGFEQIQNKYVYNTTLLNGQFKLRIEISDTNKIKTILTEVETNEIYTLHLTNAEGEFVNKVRTEYSQVLKTIADTGFDINIFKSKNTHKIIDYIQTKYNDELEYLWEKFPDNAVARRKDSKKWYLAILTVKKDRLGFDDSKKVEIINLRAKKEDVPALLSQDNIFPAYHMNKKSWISIILDETVNIDEIFSNIDESYKLAK